MTTPATAVGFERSFASIVGREHVHLDDARTIDGISPALTVAPATPQQAADALRLAATEKLTVVPAGGFTGQGMGAAIARVEVLLDLRRLNLVEHYDPGDLTIGVQAGATLAQVHSTVRQHHQLLPLDAAQPDLATIGGVLATAAHGPLKFGFGGAREFCVGVQFATVEGKLVKGGGRVVKNVAGYDLMKLLIGSFGTLGVITSANFRVFPAPPQFRTFLMEFASVGELLALRDCLLRSPLSPLALEIVSPGAENCLGGALSGGAWRLLLRAGGTDAVLRRYRADLGSAVTRELEADFEAEFWRTVSDFVPTVTNWRAGTMVVEARLPISAVGPVLHGAARTAAQHRFQMAAIGRANGSLVLAFMPLSAKGASLANYGDLLSAVREPVPRDGALVVTHCAPELKREVAVWGATPTDVATMRLLKRALDPDDILNRGRFLV